MKPELEKFLKANHPIASELIEYLREEKENLTAIFNLPLGGDLEKRKDSLLIAHIKGTTIEALIVSITDIAGLAKEE